MKKDSTSKVNRPTKGVTKTKLDTEIVMPKESKLKFDEEIQELEDRLPVKTEMAEKAAQAVLTLTTENPKLKNLLFDEQLPLHLQINSIKVPKIHSRIARIPLKHSIFTSDSEVCLIVPDVKGIPNKNHEEHLEHYEKFLQKKNVTNIKKIMTFHEFRTEYETFELKQRLVELYDVFLVDGKISGKTVKKCGKIFYKKRKVPTAIKLQASKLKEQIDQTLKKTPLYLHGNGDSFMIQIAHNRMTVREIVENIFYALKGLDKEFPGGFNNIRSINLSTVKKITIPLYLTLKNQNQVTVHVESKKSTVIETAQGELTTRSNSGVIVRPTGEIKVYELNKRGNQHLLQNENEKQSKIPSGGNKPKAKKRKMEKRVKVKNNNKRRKRESC